MQAATGSYRTDMRKILTKFKHEVDPDILQSIQCEIGFEKLHLAKEVLKSKDLITIYYLILQDNKHNIKKLVLKMIDLVFKYIKDIGNDPELETMMCDFRRRMSSDVSTWMPDKDAALYGRDNPMFCVSDFIHEPANQHIRLINVYGPSGIGKTFFVKHIAAAPPDKRGEVKFVFVDVKNATTVGDLLWKVLTRLQINPHSSATSPELVGHLFRSLRERTADHPEVCTTIILDDVSQIMEYGRFDLHLLLHQIIEQSKVSNIQLKFLVTSRCELLSAAEEELSETHWQEMTSYTFAVVLDALADEDAAQFPMDKLDEEDKRQLISLANGLPYALHLFNALARDCPHFLLSELKRLPTRCLDTFIQQILRESFLKLLPQQRKTLFSVALCDDETTTGNVCKIVDARSADALSADIKKIVHEFNRQIWLSFQTSDQSVESSDKDSVSPHHSKVRDFLRQMVREFEQGSKDQKQSIRKIKYAYINHYTSLLVCTGKDCHSFPQQSCELIVKERANICRAIMLISEESNPELLFSAIADDSLECTARAEVDIVYLFLCLYMYRHSFHHCLSNVLQHFCSLRHNNLFTALSGALNILLLTAQTDKDHLEAAVKLYNEGNYLDRVRHKITLSCLCRAILSYAQGILRAQLEDFEKSHKYFSRMEGCESVKRFFLSHLRLSKAKVLQGTEAKKCCSKASSYAASIQCLKPLVHTVTADMYITNNRDIDKALAQHKKAYNGYNAINQGHMDKAALCLYNIADLLCQQAAQLAQSSTLEAVKKLDEAKKFAIDALAIRSDNCIASQSKWELLQSFEQLALCHLLSARLFQRLYGKMNRAKEETSKAVEYYLKACQLIHTHRDQCNLLANTVIVDRLLAVSCKLLPKSPLLEAVVSTLQTTQAEGGQPVDQCINQWLVNELSSVTLAGDTSQQVSATHATCTPSSDDLEDEVAPAKRARPM